MAPHDSPIPDTVYPLSLPDAECRLTYGLLFDVAAVLRGHGFPRVESGPDLARLLQALCVFLYADTPSPQLNPVPDPGTPSRTEDHS